HLQSRRVNYVEADPPTISRMKQAAQEAATAAHGEELPAHHQLNWKPCQPLHSPHASLQTAAAHSTIKSPP
ncbi:hypothetical protein Dimus_037030, partial [Dionaea muscipula]